MNDLISRQAAIEAIEKIYLPKTKCETATEEINRVAWRYALNCAEEMVMHLPSAKQEQTAEKMNDLISRRAAIVSIINTVSKVDENKTLKGKYDGAAFRQGEIIGIIEALPPAQQEQTGRWSQVSGQATLCSCCGRASNAKQARNWSYCPYCGKKMEEMK